MGVLAAENAMAAAKALRTEGWNVINPAEEDRKMGFSEYDDLSTWSDEQRNLFMRTAMRRDCEAICASQAIALLPGWSLSHGSQVELALAKLLGLEVLYIGVQT